MLAPSPRSSGSISKIFSIGTALPSSPTASGRILPAGSMSWKNTLGTAITKCMCLDSGMSTKKMQIESMWIQ